MGRYIIKRVLIAIPVLLAAAMFFQFITFKLPDNRFRHSNRPISSECLKEIIKNPPPIGGYPEHILFLRYFKELFLPPIC